MTYTEKEIYQFLDDGVNKNLIVIDKLAIDGELTIRFLALLRKVFRENYYTHPKYLLIDKKYEEDLKLPAYQIELLPLQYNLPITGILGYRVRPIDSLQKIAEEYMKSHTDVHLKYGDKSKIVIVKNDEVGLSLLGAY